MKKSKILLLAFVLMTLPLFSCEEFFDMVKEYEIEVLISNNGSDPWYIGSDIEFNSSPDNTRYFRIKNNGGDVIQITNIYLSPESSYYAFSPTMPLATLPYPLPGYGEFSQFSLTYSGTDVLTNMIIEFHLENNPDNNRTVVIRLKGN